MKNILKSFILFLFFSLILILSNAQIVKDVLFLGNSYTYYNDLPEIISSLATASGNTFNYDENTIGSYKLEDHATNAESVEKIYLQKWDYVVLQEQSTRPVNDFDAFDNGVRLLNNEIRANQPQTNTTLLYMTWGRQNSEKYPYDEMQAGLTFAYDSLARKYGTEVSPVGVAWKKVRDDGDPINLYNADGTHPSYAGSYLAACVFYATIFHESPVGLSFTGNVSSAMAEYLQKCAFESYQKYINKGLIVTSSVDILNNALTQVFVYPNPVNSTNQKLHLSSGSPLHFIALYNSQGVRLFQRNIKGNSEALNISYLKGGIYFLKTEANNKTITRKIIVHN